MWKYVLNKMIKQKEATFFIVMIILSFAVSSAAPYLNGKFIDLLTVSKDIHLIVQFALIIVGVGVVGALISYCSNLTTVKVLTKTTMASIYEGMDNLLETDLVIAEKLDFSYITQRLFQDAKDNPNIVPTDAQYRWLVQNINEVNLTGKCHPCIDVKWGDPIDHLVRFRDTNYFMDQVSVHANGDIVVSAYLPLVVGNVRKRSLSDYWNAGLKTIWATNVVQYLTARMQSVRDMENITTLISDINMDGCLNLDLMENDLNDLNLIKGVILEEWM